MPVHAEHVELRLEDLGAVGIVDDEAVGAAKLRPGKLNRGWVRFAMKCLDLMAQLAGVGAIFVVHITPGAVRALELSQAKQVWLVLKTYSCHLVA